MSKSQTFLDVRSLVSVTTEAAPTAAYRQLYTALRHATIAGQLKPGMRLPSTRALAEDLKLSRTTVIAAYAQLRAEGYLEGKVGSGTRITAALPDRMLAVDVRMRAMPAPTPAIATSVREPANKRTPAPATRAKKFASALLPENRDINTARAFRPNAPATSDFPVELYARVAARRYRKLSSRMLIASDPAGYRPLRQEIAAYLGASRGLRCEADQIVVVNGTLQAVNLAARVCINPGDEAWFEHPGYPSAWRALADAGARLVSVPVDDEGLNVAAGIERSPNARLAFATPAHQAPLGVSMSRARRHELLDWARSANAWVFEDDFDSEYRYAGRPCPALHGLDPDGRVVYFGTFSKTLFPSLRMSYLVLPSSLVDAVAGVRARNDRHSSVIDQAIVADFLAEGHFARHVRRMRTLYAERQEAMLAAGRRELAGLIELEPCESGMKLVGWLPPGVSDTAARDAARAAGIESMCLSMYVLAGAPPMPPALLLGYAALKPSRIRSAAATLADAIRPVIENASGRRSKHDGK